MLSFFFFFYRVQQGFESMAAKQKQNAWKPVIGYLKKQIKSFSLSPFSIFKLPACNCNQGFITCNPSRTGIFQLFQAAKLFAFHSSGKKKKKNVYKIFARLLQGLTHISQMMLPLMSTGNS